MKICLTYYNKKTHKSIDKAGYNGCIINFQVVNKEILMNQDQNG